MESLILGKQKNSKTTFVTVNQQIELMRNTELEDSKTTFVTVNPKACANPKLLIKFKNNLCYC